MNAPTTVTIPTDPEQLMSEVIGRVLLSIEPYVEERDKDPNGMVALAVAAATMGLAKVMQHDLPAQRKALAEKLSTTIYEHITKLGGT